MRICADLPFANRPSVGAVDVKSTVGEQYSLKVVWRERCYIPVKQTSRDGSQGLKLMN